MAVDFATLSTANPNRCDSLPSVVLACGLENEVHDGIAAVQPREDESKALTDVAGNLDLRHDVLTRGIHGVLTATHILTGDTAYLDLRDSLLPKGLSTVQLSYLEEAGHTAMVRNSLTDGQRERLTTIRTGDATLLDHVDQWLDTGDQLGSVEQRRAQVAERAPSERGLLNQARIRWIRVVNSMIALTELVELDQAEETLLFGAMRAMTG